MNASMDLSLVGNTTSHTAVPAKVTPASPSPNLHTLPRRGHTRSASLENANSFNAKNTTGLPPIMVASTSAVTGTLKSRNDQKRARGKFGSHNNLDDYIGTPGRTKFQNIRQIFELNQTVKNHTINEQDIHNQMQSLPIINSSINKSQQTPKLGTKRIQNQLHAAYKQQYVAQQQQQQRQKYNEQNTLQQQQQQQQVNHNSQQLQQQSISNHNQQHQHIHQHYAHLQQQQLTRKTTPTLLNSYGNRHSIAEVNERLNITEQMEQNKNQQQQQNMKVQQTNTAHYHQHQHQHHHQQQTQQPQQQQKYNSLNTLNIELELHENTEQSMNLLRPIAFKPIPFEPDYSIPNRYCDVVMMNDRYGSTPSLAPVSGSNFRFGSK